LLTRAENLEFFFKKGNISSAQIIHPIQQISAIENNWPKNFSLFFVNFLSHFPTFYGLKYNEIEVLGLNYQHLKVQEPKM
jgi:hypothetical protein